MNAQGRKQIANIVDRLRKIQDAKQELENELGDIQTEIQALADDEQEKFDNMSEGLQQGEKGQAIEQVASTLGDIANSVEAECSASDLGDAISSLESIE